jgi:hypothetical protein
MATAQAPPDISARLQHFAEERFFLEGRARGAYETIQHRLGWPTPWERLDQRVRDAYIEMVEQIETSDYFDDAVEEAMDAALEDADPLCPTCERVLQCPDCGPKVMRT